MTRCSISWLRKTATAVLAGLALVSLTESSQAMPMLQLYVQGGSYSGGDETWVLNLAAGETARVWAISNGTVSDVTLSMAWTGSFDPTVSSNFSITGSTTGSASFTDPSTATITGTSAVFEGGSGGDNPPIPAHGIFNQPGPVFWQTFSLGTMSGVDSPIADFGNNFDLAAGPATDKDGNPNKWGQINVYEITANQAVSLHFDLWGYKANGKLTKAPFSHDAVVTSPGLPDVQPGPNDLPAPEPASLALLALGCVGLGGYRWRSNGPAAK